MRKTYSSFRASAAGATLLLLPGLAAGQAPTITGLTPGRHANNAPQDGPVTITFSQPVTGASNVRVFTNQRRGQRAGAATGDGTTQLSFQPSQRYAAGERVSVTIPATVRGTGAGTPVTAGAVCQFRAATGTRLASGRFSGTTSYATPGIENTPTLGDINNDGNLDFLIADGLGERVRVRLGDGLGGLGTPTLLYVGEQPGGIALADVNNDGNLDLLAGSNVASGGDNRYISVSLGNGQGGFAIPTTLPIPAPPGQVRVGDVNADGNLDIVVVAIVPFVQGGPLTSMLCVRLGNGQGSFTAVPNMALELNAQPLHLADFNNDGQLDCLVGGFNTNTFKTYLGNGQGGFMLNTTTAVARLGANDVADITGDGNLDLLGGRGTPFTRYRAGWLWNRNFAALDRCLYRARRRRQQRRPARHSG